MHSSKTLGKSILFEPGPEDSELLNYSTCGVFLTGTMLNSDCLVCLMCSRLNMKIRILHNGWWSCHCWYPHLYCPKFHCHQKEERLLQLCIDCISIYYEISDYGTSTNSTSPNKYPFIPITTIYVRHSTVKISIVGVLQKSTASTGREVAR